MISYLLGDSFSPYVIGIISDLLKKHTQDDVFDKFTSLQISLYLVPVMTLVSCACYFSASIHLVEDKNRVECLVNGFLLTSSNIIYKMCSKLSRVGQPAQIKMKRIVSQSVLYEFEGKSSDI